MLERLPVFYAVVLLTELVGLGWVYAKNPPLPSAPLSINLGWLGIGSMVLLLIYSVARRSRRLRQMARLSYWLHFHIFLACQGVMAVAFHCYHLFFRDIPVNWVNPGVVSGIATLCIFGSGLFGRYLYSMVPHSIGGVQLEARDLDAELKESSESFPEAVEALIHKTFPPPSGFFGLLKANAQTRAVLRSLKKMDLSSDQFALAQRRLLLERKRSTLRVAERFFRWWIVAHRPFAIIMYIIAFVHITFSFMFSSALASQ